MTQEKSSNGEAEEKKSSVINLEPLKAKTDALMNTTYVFRSNFNLLPKKDHTGICINYQDLQPMTQEFIEELIHTVTNYVYSNHKIEPLAKTFEDERTKEAAFNKINLQAKKKFRPSSINGQFSELLLFNFLQKFFDAVPLLRKMPITTNARLERNGADAIHIATVNSKYVLYIGEAKTYSSTKLKPAIKEAIKSILKHYTNHRKELNLYIYEDFVSPEIQNIAEDYINGKRNDLEVHLVCMITYDQSDIGKGNNREEIFNNVMESIHKDMSDVKEEFFNDIPEALLPRMNYILFPIKQLDELLAEFKKLLGV